MGSRFWFTFSVVFLILLIEVFGYAQHPGAYSSPQYAKKSIHYTQKYNQPSHYSDTEYQKISQSEPYESSISDRSKLHDIDISEYPNVQKDFNVQVPQNFTNLRRKPVYNEENNDIVDFGRSNETQSGRSAGFMESAGNFLNGRGGQMLADIAREVITRSTGASSQVGEGCWTQVLSLNLTNLVILVILKALILAAGMFGAGAWSHGYSRSLDGDSNSQWISGGELDLWLSYLNGKPECMEWSACRNHDMAKKYSGGGDLILTAAKLAKGTVPYDDKYEKILEDVKLAAAWGAAGRKCEEKYKCDKS